MIVIVVVNSQLSTRECQGPKGRPLAGRLRSASRISRHL